MEDIFEIPLLKTKRILLRPFTISDVPELLVLMKDKEISDRTLYIPYPYTEENAVDWIAAQSTDLEEQNGVVFAVTNLSDGELMGAVGLTFIPKYNQAEMGYWIGKKFWNKGYISEAAAKVLEYAFEEVNLKRVHAHYIITNPASGKVMEHIGMKYEGTLRSHIIKNGEYMDIVMYGILKEDFITLRKYNG